ncbi:hypothetical protein C8J57DRAFT_1255259 [Mycena rebaudengoi]|nr:hypothetical protein C8J57DRAFT_1255259 [Mycena rebaudengoi]
MYFRAHAQIETRALPGLHRRRTSRIPRESPIRSPNDARTERQKDRLTPLYQTIRAVGEDKWVATCSDSTNVTKAARRTLVQAALIMYDLCDCVYHIHNTVSDINKLVEFKRSSHSTGILREQYNVDTGEPIQALKKTGKTRFGTYWTSSVGLDRSARNIRQMVETGVVKFKALLNSIKLILLWYTNIVAPLIRSLWSLEAAHANASDVVTTALSNGLRALLESKGKAQHTPFRRAELKANGHSNGLRKSLGSE